MKAGDGKLLVRASATISFVRRGTSLRNPFLPPSGVKATMKEGGGFMGALGFEFRRWAFCTVHTMNVKQTVHLRELIRQELTVRHSRREFLIRY